MTHTTGQGDKEYDRNFTEQWTTRTMRYAQRVPSLGIPSRTRGVVDLYDASTDWIPIYDKSSWVLLHGLWYKRQPVQECSYRRQDDGSLSTTANKATTTTRNHYSSCCRTFSAAKRRLFLA